MASGSVVNVEITAPTSTAGTRSTLRPRAFERCTTVQFTAPASGTHSATKVPATCPPETWAAYM